VVRSLRSSGRIAHVAVVTPDPYVLSWAQEQGAIPLWQPHEGLNRGLELARAWAVERRADALLVTLGDLPTLAAHEVRALLAYGPGATGTRTVVLAPDRDERGTNLLLMRPPALLPFSFGAESFARHMAISRSIAGEPLVFHAPGTAFDVDTPDDLAELEARGLWRRSPSPQRGTPPPADALASAMEGAAHG
jgi:2-phospho-L-lactate/phosphoenolpyruvate guanylyltransferase